MWQTKHSRLTLTNIFCIDKIMIDSHPLATFRAEQAWTQDELGDRIGVDGMTISRWERRESLPQRRHWPKIEKITGIPPAEIISAFTGKAAEAAQ